MAKFLKGEWVITTHEDDDEPCVGIAASECTYYPIAECCEQDDPEEAQGHALLIAAAGTAATRAEEMGYHGVRAVEALPELLHAAELREALRKKGLLFASRHLIDEEHEAGPIALAQAHKED